MSAPIGRRSLLLASAAAPLAASVALAAAPGDRIRRLTLYCTAQASDPQEYEAAQLIAATWRQLGLDITVKAMPGAQLGDFIWYKRKQWDMTMWRMVGRPERSDPDEFAYNLFNPSAAATGYDFIDWISPAYMKVAQAQRQQLDLKKRQADLYELQAMVNAAQPYIFVVYPKNVFAYDTDVLKPASVVEQPGIGIRCFWTYLRGEPAGEKRDLILNSAEALLACNPLYISGANDSWVTEMVWDRLMRVGTDGLPHPWAAEKVEQIDPNTIDCTLRAGQKWHDGKPLTVDDVVFSFEAPMMPGKSPMYAPFVANIANVKATSDKVVRFTLKQPSAAFFTTTLAKLNIAPKHIWAPILAGLKGKDSAEQVQAPPIGSGPWKVTELKLQEQVVLEANAAHWEKPRFNRWILRILTNMAATMGMLPRGEINFLSDYRGDPQLLVDLAKKNPNVRVAMTTDIGFRFVAPNERRPPFNDPAFRRALSLATDRTMLAQTAWNGFATPANSFVSPALPFWHKPGIDQMKFNLAEAKAALAKAGYELVNGHLHYPPGVKETNPPG